VDYKRKRFEESLTGVDVVVDAVGGVIAMRFHVFSAIMIISPLLKEFSNPTEPPGLFAMRPPPDRVSRPECRRGPVFRSRGRIELIALGRHVHE